MEETLLLDVGGVCYLCFAPASTLRHLPGQSQPATLYTEMHVREDHIHLYGFLTEAERAWFRVLISISGVGPKLALAILSTLDVQTLEMAVESEDKAPFTSVSGVGPKVAVRLVTELKGKIPAAGAMLSSPARGEGPAAMIAPAGAAKTATTSVAINYQQMQDAVSALVNLGYGRSEAFAALATLANEPDISLNDLIRHGLKELAA